MKLKYSDDKTKQDWYTTVGNDMKMNHANSCSIFFVEFSQRNWSVQEGFGGSLAWELKGISRAVIQRSLTKCLSDQNHAHTLARNDFFFVKYLQQVNILF